GAGPWSGADPGRRGGSNERADHVVVVGFADADPHDLAGGDISPAGVVDEEPSVDLGGLRAEAALEQEIRVLARAFDDRFDDLFAERAQLPPRDRTLEGEDEIAAAGFLGGRGPVAGRARERT